MEVEKKQHFHLNEFAENNTILHKIEARIKIICVFFLIAVAVSLHGYFALLSLFVIAVMLNVIAKIPPVYLIKRLLAVIPFGLVSLVIFPLIMPGNSIFTIKVLGNSFSFSYEGVRAAGIYIMRFGVSFLLLMFVTGSLGFSRLMHTLKKLKVPIIFIQLIEFAVRYIFVLHAERKAMLTARKARNFKPKSILRDPKSLRTLGQTVGMLFYRSYIRSEKIYFAMLARGYKGSMPSLYNQKIRYQDKLILAATLGLGFIIILIDKGVI